MTTLEMSTQEISRSVVTSLFEEVSSSYEHKKEDTTKTVQLSCSSVSQCDFNVSTKIYKLKQIPHEGITVNLSSEEVAKIVSKKWANKVFTDFVKKLEELWESKRTFVKDPKSNPYNIKTGHNLYGWIPHWDDIQHFLTKMKLDLENDAELIALAGQVGKMDLEYDFSSFPSADVCDDSFVHTWHEHQESVISVIVENTARDYMLDEQTRVVKPPKTVEELLNSGSDEMDRYIY